MGKYAIAVLLTGDQVFKPVPVIGWAKCDDLKENNVWILNYVYIKLNTYLISQIKLFSDRQQI